MNIDVADEHRRLSEVFRETSAMLELPDEILFGAERAGSAWSPAQHLYHLWLSSSMSLHAVAMLHSGHRAVTEEGEPNEHGRTVLDTGGFPRGRMQAPENVQPPAELDRATLVETLERGRGKLDQVNALVEDLPELPGRLPHPRLGVLNASEWMRFIHLHAAHHLAIVREIVEGNGNG